MLAGFLALIAPCGGSSGLPKVAARAVEALITAPAAVTANISRLDIIAHHSSRMDGRSPCAKVRMTFVHTPSLRPDQNRNRFGSWSLAFQIVVSQGQQWIGFRVVSADRT